jgi:hypothetical protein
MLQVSAIGPIVVSIAVAHLPLMSGADPREARRTTADSHDEQARMLGDLVPASCLYISLSGVSMNSAPTGKRDSTAPYFVQSGGRTPTFCVRAPPVASVLRRLWRAPAASENGRSVNRAVRRLIRAIVTLTRNPTALLRQAKWRITG